ncbi:MAG: hypothetical protein LBN27_06860 [Prevotellaceae bacterium]|jgi:LIVCS family branched-chain amino acid:cation transporter|nr:hypothetical protein [Prevotellaceae bacterium]
MKTLNTLKIGKYTFAVSFLIGNVFLFGFLICCALGYRDIAENFALGGLLYIPIAAVINILILIALVIYGIFINKKDSFGGAAIMLLNIPLAVGYFYLGLYLLDLLNI